MVYLQNKKIEFFFTIIEPNAHEHIWANNVPSRPHLCHSNGDIRDPCGVWFDGRLQHARNPSSQIPRTQPRVHPPQRHPRRQWLRRAPAFTTTRTPPPSLPLFHSPPLYAVFCVGKNRHWIYERKSDLFFIDSYWKLIYTIFYIFRLQ